MKNILYLITLVLFLSPYRTLIASTQPSPELNIQGTLNRVKDGKSAPDGAYNLSFALYEDGRNGSILWSEIQKGVVVVNGIFNVVLGKSEPLDSALLSQPLFLQIQHTDEPSQTTQESLTYPGTAVRLVATVSTMEAQPGVSIASREVPVEDTPFEPLSQADNDHVDDRLNVTVGGYMEFFYSYNFNRPANNVTALRGFDFIHNSLTVGNFVMSTDASYKNFSMRLALNVGANPGQFYEQEPATIPSYQVPSMDRFSWQFIQEALIGWDVPQVPGLTIQAGVMATPIGIEGLPNHQTWRASMASPHMLPKDYRENWNWSRSNSFINVPDYHSGVRALYSRNDRNHFGFFLLNGQNMITDNNNGKTIALTYLWTPSPEFHMTALYMGGPERDRGAPEGQGWRHLFDYTVRWEVTKNLAFMTQFAPGFENTNFGTNLWTINVLYASWKFDNDVRLAVRYEHLLEKAAVTTPVNGERPFPDRSSSVFLRSLDERNRGGLYGYTGTLSVPVIPNHLTMRLEYRHDSSKMDWFYKGELEPSTNPHEPFIPNARNQNTVTMGLVGWF